MIPEQKYSEMIDETLKAFPVISIYYEYSEQMSGAKEMSALHERGYRVTHMSFGASVQGAGVVVIMTRLAITFQQEMHYNLEIENLRSEVSELHAKTREIEKVFGTITISDTVDTAKD